MQIYLLCRIMHSSVQPWFDFCPTQQGRRRGWKDGRVHCVVNQYFATKFWGDPMLESQKLVGSGPVQPVRWLRLCDTVYSSTDFMSISKCFRLSISDVVALFKSSGSNLRSKQTNNPPILLMSHMTDFLTSAFLSCFAAHLSYTVA